jgi:hypothetical protein
VGDEVVLTAKAIRRAEKLERTLTKLAVIQETGSAAETLLKAVQKGLDRLRKNENSAPSGDACGERKKTKEPEVQTVSQGEASTAKPSRKPKV